MDSLDVVQKQLMDIIHDVCGPHVGMPRCRQIMPGPFELLHYSLQTSKLKGEMCRVIRHYAFLCKSNKVICCTHFDTLQTQPKACSKFIIDNVAAPCIVTWPSKLGVSLSKRPILRIYDRGRGHKSQLQT